MRAKIDLPRFLVAAPRSGAGKTTVAMGLAALLAKTRPVGCFKVGPDYIDPGYLAAGSGSPVANLDGWLLPPEKIAELFYDRTRKVDTAVVEGVMGLFDGRGGGNEGSSAQIAALLKLPVILVVDATAAGRSLAALVAGFRDFDPAVHVAGVFLNRVSGPRHLRAARGPIERDTGLPIVGWLEEDGALSMPSRHLGLAQRPATDLAEAAARIAGRLRPNMDMARLSAIARAAPPIEFNRQAPEARAARSVRIGVARDDAFSFYYQENLDLLERLGAEPVAFSPLRDTVLPEAIDGLYFGGGWPELHARELAGNTEMRRLVRRSGENGLPIYAECGGLLYLTETLHYQERSWPMAGLLPAAARMTGRRQGLGYREARFRGPTILGPAGCSVRGHEFHWSIIEPSTAAPNGDPQPKYHDAYIYDDGRREGFASENVLASYLHLNWLGQPSLGRAFIDACAEHRAAPQGGRDV